MINTERYPFLPGDPTLGEASFRPYLPFALDYQGKTITSTGLLDTGASVNVLPYSLALISKSMILDSLSPEAFVLQGIQKVSHFSSPAPFKGVVAKR